MQSDITDNGERTLPTVASCLSRRGADCADEEGEINARVAKLYGLD